MSFYYKIVAIIEISDEIVEFEFGHSQLCASLFFRLWFF